VVPRSGQPFPLGATCDGYGTNFSLFSSIAQRVELCLFDEDGLEYRYDLPELTAHCWHGYFPGIRAGQRYAFRVHGPWAPHAGLRCNPSNLLLDPYAKCIEGQIHWNQAVFAHCLNGSPCSLNNYDSAPYVQRCVVSDPCFDWGADKPICTPLDMTIIYELHVKGFTITLPDVPQELRGTYLALAHPAVIEYFQMLGVTAIELMPIQQYVHDMYLLERGLKNYWGYNTIGFFAPHNEYAVQAGRQVNEFKFMVKSLHEAGLEVILDVVYGHTAEGNHLGPTLAFKGIDNAAYYRLDEGNPFYYKDYTGTGNSLNMRHPFGLQLMMDSLRYWVTEMHVDGFRFDLASTLARGIHDVDRLCAFFDVIQQDPIVNQVKLIAEPWDVSDGGYQLGKFPSLWSEWNGRFRDSVRDYWRGVDGSLGDFCLRLSGSPDLYQLDRRRPTASVNFIACHDGLTLTDLVSYNAKHNAANGEKNADGENNNRSWNCGAEGPSADERILTLRARQKRNLLTTLALSHGVPMLLAGDECGRTQAGNNNAYCQDNPTSWVNWEEADFGLAAFVIKLIALRQRHPVFRSNNFSWPYASWYRNDGKLMAPEDWDTPWAKSIGVYLDGSTAQESDADFYLAFNSHFEPLSFAVPPELEGPWRVVMHTGEHEIDIAQSNMGMAFSLAGHSIVVLTRS
jgi:isoamylase